jgi:hypothetical protein
MSRAGWRLFSCEECFEVVWMPTRDRFSPSNETCRCGETVLPIDSREDESLEVDAAGNLKSCPADRILRRCHTR